MVVVRGIGSGRRGMPPAGTGRDASGRAPSGGVDADGGRAAKQQPGAGWLPSYGSTQPPAPPGPGSGKWRLVGGRLPPRRFVPPVMRRVPTNRVAGKVSRCGSQQPGGARRKSEEEEEEIGWKWMPAPARSVKTKLSHVWLCRHRPSSDSVRPSLEA